MRPSPLILVLALLAPAIVAATGDAQLRSFVAPPGSSWLVGRLDIAEDDWLRQEAGGWYLSVFLSPRGVPRERPVAYDIVWFRGGEEVQRCGPFFSYGGADASAPQLGCNFGAATREGPDVFLVLVAASQTEPRLEAVAGVAWPGPSTETRPERATASGTGAQVSRYAHVRWSSGEEHRETMNVEAREESAVGVMGAHVDRRLAISIRHPVATAAWTGLRSDTFSLLGASVVEASLELDGERFERTAATVGPYAAVAAAQAHASGVVTTHASYRVCVDHATEAAWYHMVVAATVPLDLAQLGLASPTRASLDVVGRGSDLAAPAAPSCGAGGAPQAFRAAAG